MCKLLCCCCGKCCCLFSIIALILLVAGGVFAWQWVEKTKDDVKDKVDQNLRFLADSDELSFEQILIDGAKL